MKRLRTIDKASPCSRGAQGSPPTLSLSPSHSCNFAPVGTSHFLNGVMVFPNARRAVVQVEYGSRWGVRHSFSSLCANHTWPSCRRLSQQGGTSKMVTTVMLNRVLSLREKHALWSRERQRANQSTMHLGLRPYMAWMWAYARKIHSSRSVSQSSIGTQGGKKYLERNRNRSSSGCSLTPALEQIYTCQLQPLVVPQTQATAGQWVAVGPLLRFGSLIGSPCD